MPIRRFNKDEWDSYFPHSPKTPHELQYNLTSATELLNTRFAAISIAVQVDKPWPGLDALDDQHRIGSVRFSLGRWYIDDVGISRIDEGGGEYDIELDRAFETDWVAHMLEKTWLYDPTDFFDVLEEARRMLLSEHNSEQIDILLWQEIKEILDRGEQPYFPSRLQSGQRVYLINRMNDNERSAFCAFLANEGYAFDEA